MTLSATHPEEQYSVLREHTHATKTTGTGGPAKEEVVGLGRPTHTHPLVSAEETLACHWKETIRNMLRLSSNLVRFARNTAATLPEFLELGPCKCFVRPSPEISWILLSTCPSHRRSLSKYDLSGYFYLEFTWRLTLDEGNRHRGSLHESTASLRDMHPERHCRTVLHLPGIF